MSILRHASQKHTKRLDNPPAKVQTVAVRKASDLPAVVNKSVKSRQKKRKCELTT
jgi:hypothetical protein